MEQHASKRSRHTITIPVQKAAVHPEGSAGVLEPEQRRMLHAPPQQPRSAHHNQVEPSTRRYLTLHAHGSAKSLLV